MIYIQYNQKILLNLVLSSYHTPPVETGGKNAEKKGIGAPSSKNKQQTELETIQHHNAATVCNEDIALLWSTINLIG